MKIVLVSLALVLAAQPAAAQRRAQPFAAADTAVADSAAHRLSRPARIAVRTGTGLGGLALGGAGGLALGGLFVRRASRDGSNDLGGLGEMALSMLIGGGAGVGLGAGLPRLGAKCSTLRRVAHGFLGATAGAVVLGYAGAVVDGEQETRLETIGFFGGAGLGAAIGADC